MKHPRKKRYKPRHRKAALCHFRRAIKQQTPLRVIGFWKVVAGSSHVPSYTSVEETLRLIKRYHPNIEKWLVLA